MTLRILVMANVLTTLLDYSLIQTVQEDSSSVTPDLKTADPVTAVFLCTTCVLMAPFLMTSSKRVVLVELLTWAKNVTHQLNIKGLFKRTVKLNLLDKIVYENLSFREKRI